MFLKQAYKLDDDTTKILIGTRLKGKEKEWFHSKPITKTPGNLLNELRKMFHYRPSQIMMRRRFEERVWKRTETFRDYVHEKTILANHLTMADDEVLSYDGIPDVQLRDMARVQGFESSQSLLQAFQEILLRDRNYSMNFNAESGDRGGVSNVEAIKTRVCA